MSAFFFLISLVVIIIICQPNMSVLCPIIECDTTAALSLRNNSTNRPTMSLYCASSIWRRRTAGTVWWSSCPGRTPLSFMPSPSLYRGEGHRKRGCPRGYMTTHCPMQVRQKERRKTGIANTSIAQRMKPPNALDSA